MDIKGFPALIVGVVVALVLAGAVLPVFAETTSATDTFTNDGYYRMSAFDGDSYTIEWDKTKPTTLTFNGIDYEMRDIITVKDTYFTIFASDGAYMRVAINSANNMIVQSHNYSGNALLALDSSNSTLTTFSVSIDSDSITVSRTADSTITVDTAYSEWIYVFDDEGNYIMKNKDKSAYVMDENIIILAGVTSVQTSPATPVGVYGHGTITDLVIESAYPDDDTVYSNLVVNSSEVSAYEGLNQVSTITFDMTRDETTTPATYSYYLVPYEVTAEKAVHPDGALSVMLNVLPLLAIAGLVTGAVVWFISRKG